jgi:two-component system, chemotaxis family, protein-glutamate methylesterase/glutaminase
MSSGHPIKLMLIDDSAAVRQVVSQAVARDPAIDLIATASNADFALARMRRGWPDVIVLDLEMPRLDGLAFLRRVMSERPTPVIVCCSLAERNAETTLQALSAGAVSVIRTPRAGLKNFLGDSSNDIVTAIRAAARSNVRLLASLPSDALPQRRGGAEGWPARPKNSADVILAAGDPGAAMIRATEKVVAIGTSTGGTQALEAVLTRLPADSPGIVVVQHMPETFTGMFAERLNNLCVIEVREARNNDRVVAGRALIAPGGKHMMLKRTGMQYQVEVADGPLVNRHKPSVDVLFRSAAKFAGINAVGIIMTGMGDDGARGLKEMRDAGAETIAQDEASCVVFGMPKEAIRLGAVDRVLPLNEIAGAIADIGKVA